MVNHFTGNQRPPVDTLASPLPPSSPHPPTSPPVVGIALDSGRENVTQMIDDITVLKTMNVSADGVNALWLDAGWYVTDPNMSSPIGSGGRNWFDGYGNYSADPVRFPGGLLPVSDAAHAAGLRLILWFEPERVMKGNNEIYREGAAMDTCVASPTKGNACTTTVHPVQWNGCESAFLD